MLVAAMRLKQVKKQVDGHGGGERRCQSLTGLVQRVRIVTHEIRELPRVPDPKSPRSEKISQLDIYPLPRGSIGERVVPAENGSCKFGARFIEPLRRYVEVAGRIKRKKQHGVLLFTSDIKESRSPSPSLAHL